MVKKRMISTSFNCVYLEKKSHFIYTRTEALLYIPELKISMAQIYNLSSLFCTLMEFACRTLIFFQWNII